jgi:hypothetical protein
MKVIERRSGSQSTAGSYGGKNSEQYESLNEMMIDDEKKPLIQEKQVNGMK